MTKRPLIMTKVILAPYQTTKGPLIMAKVTLVPYQMADPDLLLPDLTWREGGGLNIQLVSN